MPRLVEYPRDVSNILSIDTITSCDSDRTQVIGCVTAEGHRPENYNRSSSLALSWRASAHHLSLAPHPFLPAPISCHLPQGPHGLQVQAHIFRRLSLALPYPMSHNRWQGARRLTHSCQLMALMCQRTFLVGQCSTLVLVEIIMILTSCSMY